MEANEKSVLGPFWGLASNDNVKQLQSAKELIVLLRNSQDEHELSSGSGLCDNLSYSVERLVRGLSSNRDGARQGFTVCLTEVLSLFDCVSVNEVLQLVDKHLMITGSARAQEERGAYFGQVCALLTIVRSGRIHGVSLDTICALLKRLHILANKKLYLREVGMVGTVQLIREVGSRLSFDENILPLYKQLIEGGWEKCTPDALYLLLTLLEIYSKNETLKKLVKSKWNHKWLLHPDNFEYLATVLKESTFAHPSVHSVWPVVLDAVRKKGHLTLFWKTVVDESVIVSSHERKYLSFKLLELLLPTLDVSEVVAVFTPNLLRCLRNNLSGADNYLNKAAKHLVGCIATTIGGSTDKSIQVSFLLQLQAQG
ncbi:uncharacterized protein [Dysidea avara]|uniref:uncharacterized protein n=1 Tax=Dysidea avara TaxID=196820 RepID=UPI0033232531